MLPRGRARRCAPCSCPSSAGPQGEFKLQGNPVVPIRSPRLRDIERPLFDRDVVDRIVAAQPDLRDRVALKLLFLIGIRKGSLAQLRLKDFDLGRRRVRIHAKGGKIRNLPLPTEGLRQELELLILGRDLNEYLLFPEVKAPRWQKGQVSGEDKAEIKVVHANRLKPLSSTALHRWWYRCLQRAGVVEPGQTKGMKMHAARYTAGTEFYLATGDIRATQQLLGHEDIGTTANIYVQPNEAQARRDLRVKRCGQRFRPPPLNRNRSPRRIAISRENGGGGNRTRVRSRTG